MKLDQATIARLAEHLETLRYRELVQDKLKGGDGTTSPDGRATA